MAAGALTISGTPVLLYHAIADGAAPRDKYAVPLSAFRAQLRLLGAEGYRSIAVEKTVKTEAGRRVAITFDDGLESDYRLAFPALVEHGLSASFFVNTANIDRPGYLRWSHLDEMRRAGMWFHSHGHRHIEYLTMDARAAADELRLSLDLLQQNLGNGGYCFSAPYGLLNGRLADAAFDAGFRLVCSSRNWPAQPDEQVIGRIAVYTHTTLVDFQALAACETMPLLERRLRESALYVPKRVLLALAPQFLGVATANNARQANGAPAAEPEEKAQA